MSDLLLETRPSLALLLLLMVLLAGLANTIVCLLVLRTTRRILRSSERRVAYLADEQQRLEFLREEHRLLEKTLEQEREERLAAQRKVTLLEKTGPVRAAKDMRNVRTNGA